LEYWGCDRKARVPLCRRGVLAYCGKLTVRYLDLEASYVAQIRRQANIYRGTRPTLNDGGNVVATDRVLDRRLRLLHRYACARQFAAIPLDINVAAVVDAFGEDGTGAADIAE
jgi:hypothetical protein